MIARSKCQSLAAPSLVEGLEYSMSHVDLQIIHHAHVAARERLNAPFHTRVGIAIQGAVDDNGA